MFPLLLSPLLTAVTSVASGAGSLALGAVKTAAKAVSATGKAAEDSGTVTDKSGKEWDRDSPQGKTVAAAQAKEEEPKDLFGGLDLAKVKSAIDDKGPMGPEEEGPKTVYKQMIKQLQNISSTLLRMEETMRMLLSIEYERIQGMISQSTTENLKGSETDGSGDKKTGLLSRGAGAVGSGIKSVYGAATKTTFRKMLGLTALILAIKYWREDLEKVMAKMLKGLKAAYDYFTAEDFKWSDLWQDLKDTWLPGFKNWIDNFLSMIWTAVKDAHSTWGSASFTVS